MITTVDTFGLSSRQQLESKPEVINKLEVVKEEIQNHSNNEVKSIIEQMNNIPFLADKLRFGFSEDIDQLLVKIYDRQSDKIIRQFPSEEFIKRVVYFRDNILHGGILDEKG